ncbi:MAG: toll/interleukin-1 receptor domain-containing protein, partial [Proteobacteria bacterium]|nr:toll/interleukin-1 receptor domain-containing protein [Pseudomonadota bacterium]
MPKHVHLITGGYPRGATAGHDMDYARLRLLKLLHEHDDIVTTVCGDFTDVGNWLEGTSLLMTYVAGPFPDEQSVEAIARRLGREGLIPWFDAWEVLAGDSLPGKIEQGLANSVAFIAILTADYAEGRWATEELESAIHRRVTEDYPIVPVLLEQCEKPELIRHLVHVDFSAQDPDQFESKCGELIDAINRLDRN